MANTLNPAFLRFAELLELRAATAPPERDIRSYVLSKTGAAAGFGYIDETLTKGFGANLPHLFPGARGVDAAGFSDSEVFFLTGTIFRDLTHSHKGGLRLFDRMPPGGEVIFYEPVFLATSHSWSHAFREARPEYACLGYVYDDLGYYFMADYPNRLIRRLNGDDTPDAEELGRARALIARIVEQRISKYNAQPFTPPATAGQYPRRVLVCDQAYADASTAYGGMGDADYERMLYAALQENPDAEILVKTHPDSTWEKAKRAGYFSHLHSTGRLRILRQPVNPFVLFDMVDKVYVGTSQMGLEALFAGLEVVCFGAPFYAGWGLTDDRRPIAHRQRARSLEELFHYFYIWYSVYHVPDKPAPAQIEDVLDFIEAHRPYAPPAPAGAPPPPPRVSVIIPVYNVEAYIEECLASVQGQTLRDIEIITVNDCSPDASQEIIDRLAAEDDRIRPLILAENAGQGFARNAGIEAARGDYVWFIDSDDWMSDPGALKTLVETAERTGSDMVRARKAGEMVFSAGGEFLGERPDPSDRFFDTAVEATTFRDSPEILHNRHFWTWLYRRRLLTDNGIRFVNPQWEERPFLIAALLAARQLTLTRVAAVAYRVRTSSTARRDQTRRDIDLLVNNFHGVAALLLEAGADRPDSGLRRHLDFTLSQYVHYLFFGAPYQYFLEQEPAALKGFLDDVAGVLRRCGFTAQDFDASFTGWSARHLQAGVYQLIIAALAAGRHDMVARAAGLRAVAQDRLYAIQLPAPEDDDAARFQDALNRYARNGLAARARAPGRAPARRPRVVIHTGSTKTGSTALQSLMEENRHRLLREGIWFPEQGLFWQKNRPHKQAGHAHFAPAAIRGDQGLRDYIEAGLAALGGRVDTIVLSSEAFFLNPASEELARYFEGFPVEMVVYLRRQDEWASAQYGEFVAGGAVGRVAVPVGDWLETEETAARLDYRGMLERWAGVLGRSNIHVRVYEKGQLEGGDIVDDFAATAGLPALAALPRPARPVNSARLSAAHVELLRQYNARPFHSQDAYFDFIETVGAEISAWRAERGMEMPAPWLLEEDQAARIMAAAADGNSAIARSYLGRDDGVLFRAPARRPDGAASLDAEEMALIGAAYERHARRPAPWRRKPGARIVNYGLFGWRLWALTPLVFRLYASRADKQLQQEFLAEPALFARAHWGRRRPGFTRLLYPDASPLGPGRMLRAWVPLLTPLARRRGGEEYVRRLREDPVGFTRSFTGRGAAIVGRLLFPCGEVRRRP